MKTILCFLISSLFVISSQAQTDFQKYFDFSTGDYLTDMIQTSDGSILLCGYTSYGILVIKTDLNGELVWQKDFQWSQNAKAYDICESNTYFYYLSGEIDFNYGFVMKLNKDGDSITSQIYEEETSIYAIGAVNSDIKISIEENGINTNICNTDTTLNDLTIQYSYTNKLVHKITITENDWYFIGYKYYMAFDWTTFIRKAYSFQINFMIEDYPPEDLIISENNSIYFSYAGSNYYGSIMKTNESGETLWTSPEFSDFYNAYSIHLYKNKLVATGSISNQLYFSIIDTIFGAVDSTFVFNDFYSQNGKSIVINGDDLYIAGNLQATDSIDNTDVFLNKYSLDTIINSIYYTNRKQLKLNIYPNPASEQICFTMGSLGIHTKGKLNCFNINGNIVFDATLNPGQKEIKTDISSWPTGIYIGVVYVDGIITAQQKFVVQ